MIFCTHRELYQLRPHWRPPETIVDCPGRMRVDPETEMDDIKIADCTDCDLTIGIPPRQWNRWLEWGAN